MRILVITEKAGPSADQRDGGARLIESLRLAFGERVSIAQFGDQADPSATWHLPYPTGGGVPLGDRFAQRLHRASFIARAVEALAPDFTDVVFVHASMQFRLPAIAQRTWTLPMFLTPSYVASGERVPRAYTEAEARVLAATDRVLTPSHLERRQLIEGYGVEEGRIRVIPRGVRRHLFPPRVRRLSGPPLLCSIGSIKPQKDPLALLSLFARLRADLPGARLRLIGPVQDAETGRQLQAAIQRLGLTGAVELTGHLPPCALANAVADAHLHLSASRCETFGRAIFESLAAGLPNVARRSDNAAAEYLAGLPYARFHDDEDARVAATHALLTDLPRWSALATEVGDLYDDARLSRLLAAELSDHPPLAVADWDGTLFHKDSSTRTARSIEAFSRYAHRVLCTARDADDVLRAARERGLEVDFVVALSGALVTDGRGRTLWSLPVDAELPGTRPVISRGLPLQRTGPPAAFTERPDLRVEIYQGQAFASAWAASKLRAVVRLLDTLGWTGPVRAFGDGPYDEELLLYFDGVRVLPAPLARCPTRQATELVHA